MKVLVLSDIHGNLEALQTTIEYVNQRVVPDQVWVLGDTVGYGPHPNECLELLSSLSAIEIAGNHEKAVLREISTDDFNDYAREAVQWTRDNLSEHNLTRIAALQEKLEIGEFTLCHGSPRDPMVEYLTNSFLVERNLKYLETKYCLFGHTHQPRIYASDGNEYRSVRYKEGESVSFGNDRVFINPGSVGQPRDSNPSAAFAVLDTIKTSVTMMRTRYDILRTSGAINSAGLPRVLGTRLISGE
jgi:putative phosphoesterase